MRAVWSIDLRSSECGEATTNSNWRSSCGSMSTVPSARMFASIPLNIRKRPLYLRLSASIAACCCATCAIVMPPAIGRPYEWSVMPAQRCAAREAGLDDRIERLGAVAPDRVHLEIAAVLRARRRAAAREDLAHGRAAEEMLPQRAQLRDLLLLARLAHRPLDERRRAVVDQLARDAIGRRADAGHRLERVRLARAA